MNNILSEFAKSCNHYNVFIEYLNLNVNDKYKYTSQHGFTRQINKFLPNDVKYCSRCDKILSINEFDASMRGSHNKSIRCKKCAAEYRSDNFIRYWCHSRISNHKTNGNIINITVDELYNIVKNSPVCSLCGCELKWESGKRCSNSPSLDRKNNSNIITKDNIMIVCDLCNTSKQYRTIDELYNWCITVKTTIEGWRGGI